MNVKLAILAENRAAAFIVIGKHQAAQYSKHKLEGSLKHHTTQISKAIYAIKAIKAMVNRKVWNFNPFGSKPSKRTVFVRGE